MSSFLFVCLGNICRSPTAEGVFAQKAKQQGFSVKVDSAGTGGFRNGAPPDARSQRVASERGYDLSKLKCRIVNENDFVMFDHIIAMDNKNVRALKDKCPEKYQHKISLLLSHADNDFEEVPDPYYGGGKGFELVLDLIEKGCDDLITAMRDNKLS